MATTRVMGMRPRSPVDSEEFLQHLYRGGELLAQGKLIEARECLERAHGQQPRSEKAQNLLGLTYFKLGLFDRAAELYEALIRDNPVDATLRVNLGLVYLKTNALQRAIREFELATDLSPEHKKAHNYLGLALAQAGQYGRARTHFLRAGSDGMAQKMVRAIAGEGFTPPRPVQPAQARGFAEIEGHDVVAERGGEQVQEQVAPRQATAPKQPAAPAAAPAPAAAAPTPAAAAPAARPGAPAEQGWGAQFGLDETAASGAIPPPAELRFVEHGAAELSAAGGQPAESSPSSEVAQADVPSEQTSEAELASAAEAPPAAEAAPRAEEAAVAEVAASAEGATGGGPAAKAFMLEPVTTVAPPAAWSRVLETAPAAAGGTWQGAHVLSLGTLAPAVQLESAGEVSSSFQPGRTIFSLQVESELLTRLQGLVAWSGNLRFQPEMKRFRGRTTDRPFGEGAARMARASGRGVLHVEPGERTFLALALAGDSAYFREPCVFAFEESVVFENGRVPSEVAPDVDLVHLRGQGRVLLSLDGALRSLPVHPEEPVSIPLSYLVGWHGDLSPRVVLPVESEPGSVALELAGEGFALIALPVR